MCVCVYIGELLFDTIPGEVWTNVYLPQIGNQWHFQSTNWWTNEFGGVTCRSRNDPKSAASPKPSLAGVTAHESGNLISLHYLQAAQQVGEDPFPMAQLIWDSSRRFSSFRLFGWSLLLLEVWACLIVFTVVYSLGGKSLVNLVSQRLPDAIMSHLLPVIMSFLAVFYFPLEQPVGSFPVNILSCFPPRLEGFNSIGNCYTTGAQWAKWR